MNEKLSRNFTRSELQCPCCSKCLMCPAFIDRLQVFRDIYGKPLIVVSGFRCEEHNAEVGGSLNSDHLYGKAVDLRVHDKTSVDLYRLRELAFRLHFKLQLCKQEIQVFLGQAF